MIVTLPSRALSEASDDEMKQMTKLEKASVLRWKEEGKKAGRAVSSSSAPPPLCVSALLGWNVRNDRVGSIKKGFGLHDRISEAEKVCGCVSVIISYAYQNL